MFGGECAIIHPHLPPIPLPPHLVVAQFERNLETLITEENAERADQHADRREKKRITRERRRTRRQMRRDRRRVARTNRQALREDYEPPEREGGS